MEKRENNQKIREQVHKFNSFYLKEFPRSRTEKMGGENYLRNISSEFCRMEWPKYPDWKKIQKTQAMAENKPHQSHIIMKS